MKVARYFRLYLYFLRFSFSRALEFRMDFYFRIVMDCIYYFINIATFKIIFLHTSLLGGWTSEQMMVFVGTFITLDALQMTVISNNMWFLPYYVNKGDLDYYLVRPVSSLFILSLRDFSANSFMNLLIAGGFLVWSLAVYPGELGWARLLLFTVFLLLGCVLYYFMRLLSVIPVFWTHSNRGLDAFFWNLTRILEKPDGIFVGPVRWVFTTILPFCLMASFPARVLFEANPTPYIVQLVVTVLAFALLIRFLWGLALRSYSSASS